MSTGTEAYVNDLLFLLVQKAYYQYVKYFITLDTYV